MAALIVTDHRTSLDVRGTGTAAASEALWVSVPVGCFVRAIGSRRSSSHVTVDSPGTRPLASQTLMAEWRGPAMYSRVAADAFQPRRRRY